MGSAFKGKNLRRTVIFLFLYAKFHFLMISRYIRNPVSILYKSIAGRYRPVSYPDGPITARYRFIKNAYWEYTL